MGLAPLTPTRSAGAPGCPLPTCASPPAIAGAGGDAQVDSGTPAGAVDSPAPPPGSASGAAARADHNPSKHCGPTTDRRVVDTAPYWGP